MDAVLYSHGIDNTINYLEADEMTNEKFFEMFIESARKAYIEVMGEEKWNSLTDQEKHDAVMFMAKDMAKAFGAI